MSIARMNNNHISISTTYQDKLKESKQNQGKKEDAKNSHSVPEVLTISQRKNNKFSAIDSLMKQKENLEKRIESQSKQLMTVKALKDQVPYEEVIQVIEGREVITKVYTEEAQKVLDILDEQESGLVNRIEDSNKELLTFDAKIAEAMVQEGKRRFEEKQAEMKEEIDKAKEKESEKPKTEEELKQDKEKRQAEFLIQGDAVKKYVQSGKIIAAKLEEMKVRKEWEMAIDSNNFEHSEQRAEASKDIARQKADGIEEPKSKMPSIANSSVLSQRERIAEGKFAKYEAGDAKELQRLDEAIARTQDNINAQLANINKDANRIREKEAEDENNEKDENDLQDILVNKEIEK